MPQVGDVDHVIHLVRDLDRGDAAMARLGFRTTPRGLHSAAMGTANSTIVFGNGTYVELLAVLSETPLNEMLVAQLAKREGPAGIAFKTSDARAAAADFGSAGIGAGEATDFARPVELPGGAREAAFTIARIDPAATPGAWTFVCQHHSPDVVWREDFVEQPNGVTGLIEVVGMAADLRPIERRWRQTLGDRVERDDEAVLIRTGTAAVRFLAPLAYAERFGRVPRSGDPHLVALSFATPELDRTRQVLASNGVRVGAGIDDGLIVWPELAAGAVLEFRQVGPERAPAA